MAPLGQWSLSGDEFCVATSAVQVKRLSFVERMQLAQAGFIKATEEQELQDEVEARKVDDWCVPFLPCYFAGSGAGCRLSHTDAVCYITHHSPQEPLEVSPAASLSLSRPLIEPHGSGSPSSQRPTTLT